MHDLAQQILDHARELGFDLARIAPAELPPKYHAAFRRWVESGRHGQMAYLERRLHEARPLDLILPGAASCIVLAANYFRPGEEDPPGPEEGLVSRYAVTRDYHKTLTSRLRGFGRWLETTAGAGTRWYVDTGPILERAYAETAGLGYIGRNTCVITREHGSWVFLSVILTTLPLPPTPNTLTIRCGSCRRCVDACPTRAILPDHTVDARRCISYLTIENRGPIPEELRPAVGPWLFGCDICQDVCPHNHRAVPARLEDFRHVRIGQRRLPLAGLLDIPDDDAFRQRFAGTPVMRAKRLGLLRNACVVAGNSGNPELLAPLARLLARETDPMLLDHAHWAVRRLSQTPPDPPQLPA